MLMVFTRKDGEFHQWVFFELRESAESFEDEQIVWHLDVISV